MKARHVCAAAGVAIAVAAILFVRSLITTNDAQALCRAKELLENVPVPADSSYASFVVDYRDRGRVMQGPPVMAVMASAPGIAESEVVVTKAMFMTRHLEVPKCGDELKIIGERGAYSLRIAKVLDWDKPVRGYPNAFISTATMKTIDEKWQDWKPFELEELSELFRTDEARNFNYSRMLLIWAAVLTSLCLLVNALFLSIEANRRNIALSRVIGATRFDICRGILLEGAAIAFAGLLAGVAISFAALVLYVNSEAALFPSGWAYSFKTLATVTASLPVVTVIAVLLAVFKAFRVKALEADSARHPKWGFAGMLVSFAFGFGSFVAIEGWGSSLMKSFVPSPEWPDAIVSILPAGVSAFDIEKLQHLPGVKRIHELQPLQVNLLPLEEMKPPKGSKFDTSSAKGRASRPGFGMMRGRGKQYRNALLFASDMLPQFKFEAGDRESALAALKDRSRDACLITSMMARSRNLKLGDKLELDCGGGLVMKLDIVGILDLNWHMVTSRALVRGLNRMPNNTDGPVFVNFDTLAAADRRPQELVAMTHLWLDYEKEFLASHGAFEAGRIVEREILSALGGAKRTDNEDKVRGNTVRLHSRDEIADGTLAHGNDIIGAMAKVPFIFIAVVSLGFIAMIIACADARKEEFRVLRSIGATRLDVAKVLSGEALKVAVWGICAGATGGAITGWLFTFGTRKAMANWGIPPAFAIPWQTLAIGAAVSVVIVLAVAIPSALYVINRRVSLRKLGLDA